MGGAGGKRDRGGGGAEKCVRGEERCPYRVGACGRRDREGEQRNV